MPSVSRRPRITLTASRWSQVPKADSPRKVPSFCQARTKTSWTTSSASSSLSIRRARLVDPGDVAPVEPLEGVGIPAGGQRRVHRVRIGPAGRFVLQRRRSSAGWGHRGGIGSCDGLKRLQASGRDGRRAWAGDRLVRLDPGHLLLGPLDGLRHPYHARSPPRPAPTLSCKGWHQEAALRMLMNNLDPAVAERPEELIVYGGGGKAARNWECYERIVATLRRLENDETLLVQSGKPVGVFRTHEEAPRVLIANAHLVPRWATWDEFRRLDALGLTMYGQMTAGSWIYIGTQGILQGTYETFAECARQHFGGTLEGRLVVTGGLGGMGGAQPLAATMNGAAFLGVDVDESRIRRRVETRYCDRLEHDLDAALAPGRRGAGAAPGALRGAGRQHRRGAARAGPARASCPTCSPTRPRRTTSGVGLHPGGPRRSTQAAELRERDPAGVRGAGAGLDGGARAGDARPAGQGRGHLRLRQQPSRARWPTTGACARPSTSPASCPPSSARSSAAARARSAGPRSPAIRPTSPRPTRRCWRPFPENDALARWIRQAQERVQFQGLPARICWLEYGERAEMGLRFNWLVKHGKVARADRDRARPPRHRLGGVAQPRDRGDAGRLRRHRRLAAAQRAAQHRLRRELGVAAPRRRRGHRLLDPRRHGGRGRRHRHGRPAARAGAHRRSRHRRHAPRGRGVRAGDRDGAGAGLDLPMVNG